MLILLFLSNFHRDDVYEIPKMQAKNDKQSFTFSFFNEKPSYWGKRANNLWENKPINKTNQWAQTKWRFPNVPFAKHILFYMQMQVFLFSFFNVMNAEKKLGALNQQFKWFLLSRNEEYKQQFLFWRKNKDFNNNFSYQGNEYFTTISYFESKWFLMWP